MTFTGINRKHLEQAVQRLNVDAGLTPSPELTEPLSFHLDGLALVQANANGGHDVVINTQFNNTALYTKLKDMLQ